MKVKSPMLKKFFSQGGKWLLLLSLAGCAQTLTNVTPSVVQRNPSNRYRFTTQCNVLENKVIPGSFKLGLVIDGKEYPLQPEALTPTFFYYDHILGVDRSEAKYYFVLNYQKNYRGRLKDCVAKTPLANFKIQECCCFSLDCERAPVGADVKILGRGFMNGDRVFVGEYGSVTACESENVLSFEVPQVMCNKSYPVYCLHNNEKVFVGNIWVDSNCFTVEPTSIDLMQGDQVNFTVSLSSPLNYDLNVNITTDIPNSVIMPELKIEAGESSATVTIEGGEGGKGHLFVSAQGFEEQEIPIEVEGDDQEEDDDEPEEAVDDNNTEE